MSNFGGPNSAFEKDFAYRFGRLNKKIKTIENQIQAVMYRSIKNSPKITASYWGPIERQLRVLYSEMNAVFSEWAKKEIPARYQRSIAGMQIRINNTKSIINTAKKSVKNIIDSAVSKNITGALWQSARDSFLSSSARGLTNMNNVLRATKQTLINESLLETTLAVGFETTLDLRKAAAKLAGVFDSELWGTVDKKQFVQAGGRKYTASYYAEMVARSKFHEAQSQAAKVQASNYDTDLIQISSHNTTTKICMPFEGKIFSLSGKDKRFPPYTEATPYHPNCLHLEFPTFESAMEVQGTLDSFSDFSRGKINRPPVPSGFVPVDQRGELIDKAKKQAKVDSIIRRRKQAKALAVGREVS